MIRGIHFWMPLYTMASNEFHKTKRKEGLQKSVPLKYSHKNTTKRYSKSYHCNKKNTKKAMRKVMKKVVKKVKK